VRFLVDAQLPPALARWLVGKGHEAEHVADCGLAEASDRAIWRYALDAEAVILTKDEDFSVRKTLEPTGPVIVWIRLGNTRREALLQWFETMLPDVVSAVDRGDGFIEID
jgi:predicted nuclease of predicted toxin-antitoxin system